MSNANLPRDLKPLPDSVPLRAALRALPQVAPEPGAWPELAARLAANVRTAQPNGAERARAATLARRRYFVPAAVAACAVLAFAAVQQWRQPGVPPIAAPVATVAGAAASTVHNAANSTNIDNATTANAGDELLALQQRSQALEHWLHETAHAGTPLRGQDLAAAVELEDMIGLVDMQLGAVSRDDDVALWKRRVAFLEDLAALRYSSYGVAENSVAASTPANRIL